MKFNPSAWPINNRTSIYVLTIIITLIGLISYINLPKEQFPEVKFPKIIVQTINPGTSPENMENLVSKPIEKQLKNITGIKKVTSNSFQDFSVVIAEFNTDVKVEKAKKDVQDGVDKAKSDPNGLPKNLPNEPEVKDIDVSEFPIRFVNISGNYDVNRLEEYADRIKDKIESLKEIKRVDKVGGLDREIQINVDLFSMQAAELSFRDIQNAIAYENIEATPGVVKVDGEQRIISVKKVFKSAEEIGNVVIKNPRGATLYLKDIAQVVDSYKEQESFARLNTKNVITLNIIKASGKNLIDASEKIDDIIKEMKGKELPKDLSVVVTGDQSDKTKTTLHDLINTIIIGFVLVTFILMFFMGTTNALFVALSVPLSCAIAFMVLPSIGFTLNMIVLFSFLLALGIVVDDAIVVIENSHRIFHDEDIPIKEAVTKATGEVFIPVLSGTITTLLPFIPLAFWKGVIGSFMFYLPITLIITLLASLLVAYIINPVFAVDFMKKEEYDGKQKIRWSKGTSITSIIFIMLGILMHVFGAHGFANFVLFILGMFLLNKFVLVKIIHSFQTKVWPRVVSAYLQLLSWALNHRGISLATVFFLFVLSIVLIRFSPPKTVTFPTSEPNFTYVYLTMPEGTDQVKTNETLKQLEVKVFQALDIDPATNKSNPLVTSVISNVKVGATDQKSGEIGDYPNRGKITISFVPFEQRHGKSTQALLDKVRENVKGIAGTQITVDKESSGPPTAKPILIEITGENLDTLISTSKKLKNYLDNKQIAGVEELKSDFQANKPEIIFDISRSRMNVEGISTGMITQDLRTAMFGMEISRFKDANDDYPITLRLNKDQRNNIDIVKNINMTYRDMAMGGAIRQVPIGSFVDLKYGNTYGGIKRQDEKRIITLSSNVLSTSNANEVVQAIQNEIDQYNTPAGVNIKMGGEQEEQKESGIFLMTALGISFVMIFLVLIIQFNSFSRTVIIMSEIFLSITGVLLGIWIFNMDFVVIMTGIGIVALAGIVVRNGILLIEFADLKLAEGLAPREALMEAGRTRMTPVVLTASATILGLVPLAVGLNMDFALLFQTGNPHIFFGGDNVAFWGPLSWTMIFGLGFATILTLIIVPVMMLMALNRKQKILNALKK
ncbi:MAG: efflux RND transporter permease subunit [Bacteroidetes bacterium]|jgi:multidrug efflux pump|nr:efflux RND transporter permease subunit [Bacteroidota bacterium]MBK8329223.1 efflux RND transporter permease subunit [Bacteroidota bacterium]MBK9300849.1 efflux RND transporter permease subunit [Bacteroidota bacterium]MBK9480531.1 efflux RND transporter permease subunit [Bacteroidota bacterium]